MKNKLKMIGILIVALVLLLIVTKLVNNKKDIEVDSDIVEKQEYIVTSFPVSEIVATEYIINNEVSTYVKTERGWELEGSNLSIDNVIVNLSTVLMSNFTSSQKFEENNFGTAREDYQAKAILKDGREVTFSIGDKTPDGIYNYIEVKGGNEDGIYLIPSVSTEALVISKSYASNKTLEQLDFMTMSRIVINQRDYQNLVLAIPEEEVAISDNLHGISMLIMETPYPNKTIFMQSFVDEVFSTITELKFDTLIENDVTDFAKYGLDNPFIHINILSDNGEINLLVGDKTEDNTYYVKNYNENHVFTMTEELLKPFINVDCFVFLNRFILTIPIDKVDEIEFKCNDESFVIKDMSDSNVSTEKIMNAYKSIASIELSAYLGEFSTSGAKVYASLDYKLKDGSEEMFEFYEYDSTLCAYLDKESNQWFLVSKRMIDESYKNSSSNFKE